MLDFFRRLLIVFVMAVCITILFIGGTVSFANDVEQLTPAEWIWPTIGEISDTYGTREGTHFGIDIAAPAGTPIIAVESGVVTKSYYSDTYGHVIFISHPNGYETVYAHLDQRLADEGQSIEKAEKIGTVGNTGRSSGNHLHFEVHEGGWNLEKTNSVDPFLVLGNEPPRQIAATQQANYAVMASYYNNGKDENTKHRIIVKEGDTLWDLASTYHISIDKIKKENQLSRDLIVPGQLLVISKQSTDRYLVKKGDTLSEIARENDLSVKTLKVNNQLADDTIYPGDILILGCSKGNC